MTRLPPAAPVFQHVFGLEAYGLIQVAALVLLGVRAGALAGYRPTRASGRPAPVIGGAGLSCPA
jgi:hypothetical protein